MSNIRDAKNYVLSKVVWPALESESVSKKTKDKAQKTSNWINSFRKVGDLYSYIKRYSGIEDARYSSVYTELKDLGLIPIEDIILPFEAKFKDQLEDRFTVDDLELEGIYTSWDLASISEAYNVQRGIYLVEDSNNVTAILIKVTLGEGKYPNSWLEYDEILKYNMYSHKNKFDPNYKSNKAIIDSDALPIYTFVKVGTKCTYIGNFSYVSFYTEADDSKWFKLKRIPFVKGVESFRKLNEVLDEKIASLKDVDHLEKLRKLKQAPKTPAKKRATVDVYDRSPYVISIVLQRADGSCELCKNKAPFIRKKDNTPYLEVHHVTQLSEGGEDTIENAIAICPNCHRKEHFGV